MKSETKNVMHVNERAVLIDDILIGFTLFQKPSSNVEYFGIDYSNGRLFVQFKGGTGSYMYHGVPIDIMHAAKNSETIGKLVSSQIVGKYESDKFPKRMVTLLDYNSKNFEPKPSSLNQDEPTF